MRHDDSVLFDQRHDISDGGQGREGEHLQQQRPLRLPETLRIAPALEECPGKLEDHPRPAQFGEGSRCIRPHGMDQQIRLGELHGPIGITREGVVIRDDQLDSQLPGTCTLGEGGDATVDGDDQVHPLLRQPLDGPDVQPVALVHPGGARRAAACSPGP